MADSACQLIAFNDDTATLNSRLTIVVPADGQVVVAATAYPDFNFVGSGEGTYRLTIAETDPIGRFLFASDFAGGPLGEGTYQVQAFATGYEFLTTDPFAVTAEESVELGDLGLEPFRFIGSLSGRLERCYKALALLKV